MQNNKPNQHEKSSTSGKHTQQQQQQQQRQQNNWTNGWVFGDDTVNDTIAHCGSFTSVYRSDRFISLRAGVFFSLFCFAILLLLVGLGFCQSEIDQNENVAGSCAKAHWFFADCPSGDGTSLLSFVWGAGRFGEWRDSCAFLETLPKQRHN